MDSIKLVEIVEEDVNRIALRDSAGNIKHILNFNEGGITLDQIKEVVKIREEVEAKKAKKVKPSKKKAK